MEQGKIKEKYKILVADDEQVVRDIFSRLLSGEDYEIFPVGNGKEALDRITEDNFDLLLLDLNMPVMNGMEVIVKINEAAKDLIIIVITGYATLDTAKEAIKQGCFDYITKPFNIDEVKVIIDRAFYMRRLREDKKRLEEQLRIAEKLASLSQMGAGVAHEVNTILTSIKLFLEMLKEKPENRKEAKRTKLMLDEIERGEELIHRFLNFTKPSESEFSRTDINQVIRRSLAFQKARLEKENIEIALFLDEGAPGIFCDAHKMEEVFLNYYGGEATNLDFIKETEKSRLTINSWVEEQTSDRIRDLIPQGALISLTRLVLTNAVYFKGFWLKQFDKNDTRDEDFRVGSGNTIKTPMMHLSGKETEFNYVETEELQILELPYKGEDLSMLILLPKGNDLKAVEESLSVEKLSEWKRLLRREEVKVYLPRFKFEKEYFMKNTLEEMGMPTTFTLGIDFGGEADFSGMTGRKNLNIDEVIQKAFVEVNEEGTEAAAATAVIMLDGAVSRPSRIKIFKADHPFIFLIQEKETGNVLFVGRVSNPKAAQFL